MGFGEQSRHDLHSRLVEAIGEEAASTLMSSLPPDRWDHLATKDDLAALSRITKDDLDAHRQATKDDLAALSRITKDELTAHRQATKDDLADMRQATKGDLADMRQATKDDFADVRQGLDLRLESLKFELLAALHQEINGALTAQTRVTVFTMAGSIVGLAGLAMAMARFA